MVDIAMSGGKDQFVEQLTLFMLDVHQYQRLSRAISSGNF